MVENYSFDSIFHALFETTALSYIVIYIFNKIRLHFKITTKVASPIAGAALGISPGCAGAISSSAMYDKGNAKLGFLIAALIATMGDGAYVLMTKNPKAFAIVIVISFIVATLTGFIFNRFNISFSKNKKNVKNISKKIVHSVSNLKKEKHLENANTSSISLPKFPKEFEMWRKKRNYKKNIFEYFSESAWKIFIFLMPIIIFMTIGSTFKLIPDSWVHSWFFESLMFIVETLIIINAFVVYKLNPCKETCSITCDKSHNQKNASKKTFDQLSHIIVVISIALIAIKIISNYVNLSLLFNSKANIYFIILIVAAISALPGSTPHLLVLSLFIEGNIPFACLLASSISSSGDATFILFGKHNKTLFFVTFVNLLIGSSVGIIYYLIFG